MARVGRKPQTEALVERLDGSSYAKKRLEMFIKTMRQELTIPDACQRLGIGESRFHALRNQWLQEALQLLEPRRVGRPPKKDEPINAGQIEALQSKVDNLQGELVASEVRRQMAQVMPHILKDLTEKRGRSVKSTRNHPR